MGGKQDTALVLSARRVDAGGKRGAIRVWMLGVSVAKAELYRWLKLDWPTNADDEHPPGSCHFPEYSEDYFKQLTAERLIVRTVRGYPRPVWELEHGRRNEALDCRVYNMAAFDMIVFDVCQDVLELEKLSYIDFFAYATPVQNGAGLWLPNPFSYHPEEVSQ